MSAEDIPVEILVMIFKNLNGRQAVACRAVCRRWRDVVDSLSDEVWERYCCSDFRHPKAAQKVSNLSFRELYKSLALWSQVEKAEVTCKIVTQKLVQRFKILNNNTLALLVINEDEFFSFYINQIQYYNLETMELISVECFDFEFILYDENEKLIVLLGVEDRLWVVTKASKKRILLGLLYNENPMCNFRLFDTDVYYINRYSFLCQAQLKVVDNEETVETAELTEIRYSVLGFAYAGRNSVYILTEESIMLCYEGADLKFCIHIGSGGSTILTTLMEFGFDWTNPFVYKWLKSLFDSKEVGLPALKTSVIHSHTHNNIILVGTPRRVVHIFKRSYKKNKSIKLYKAKPNKSIEVIDTSTKDGNYPLPTSIHQLGVVEVLNGHRLIVLNLHKLYFVDLLHNTVTNQSGNCTGLRTNAKKKSNNNSAKVIGAPSKTRRDKPEKGNKNKRATKVLTKRVYNTRSMDKRLRNKKKCMSSENRLI